MKLKSGRTSAGAAIWSIGLLLTIASPLGGASTLRAEKESGPGVSVGAGRLPARVTGAPQTLSDYLETLQEDSGYRIEVLGRLPEVPAPGRRQTLEGDDVFEEVDKVLEKVSGLRYVLELDDKNRTIIVRVLESITEPGTEAVRRFSHLPARAARARDMSVPTFEERPDLYIFEGLDDALLESLKAEHAERMRHLSDNTVVSPPSDSGPGITLGELRRIKAANAEARKRNDDLWIPPSPTPPLSGVDGDASNSR